ncbi:MAG: DUF3102 domain-containing protein [Verrucomicrobiae bacterium]|nr:DUF3102 domain-containing protein [Verrucomicrobiae bacterium]
MILDTETAGASAPATTEKNARAMARAARAKTDKAKDRTRALEKLAAKIRDGVAEMEPLIGKFGTAILAAAEHACGVGRLLNEAKARVAHGAWEPWLAENVPALRPRTARRWMSAAKRPSVADLGGAGSAAISVSGAMRLLADDPENGDAPNGNREENFGVADQGVHRDAGQGDDVAKTAPHQSEPDDGPAAHAAAPAPGPTEKDSPAHEATGPIATGHADDGPTTLVDLLETSARFRAQIVDAMGRCLAPSRRHRSDLMETRRVLDGFLGVAEQDPEGTGEGAR